MSHNPSAQKCFDVFDDLIAPVTPERFFSDFWEKQLLHLKNGPGTFDHLFSINDVDRWLMTVRDGISGSVAIAGPSGAEKELLKYRPQDIAVDSIYESFANGHSVVLNYLENCWPPLSGLVKMLGSYFCADIGVNVYLTPKSMRTFPIHVDDHDAFILQVNGKKVWHLHELTLLSVMRLEHRKDLEIPSEWGKSRLETPEIAEIQMEPGDVLYIPRGMPHYAVADNDTASLHLTVSIMPLYWTDFLKAAVEQAAMSAPELRKTLRPGFVNDSEACENMREEFAAAMRAFQERSTYDTTLEVLRRSRVRQQGFPLDGHFSQIEKASEVTRDSTLERRGSILCMIDDSEPGYCRIRFGPRQVRGPARLRRTFEFVRDCPLFTVSQLPGLDDEGKLVLARRLIREGLLRLAAAPRALPVAEP
jgi:ribosomal protein L16 Arg81 hydroxylase